MSSEKTNILTTQSKAEFDTAVAKAAGLLRQDEVVAVPTETVYGLAGNALSENAVQRIYQIKGRPSTNPLIVHVASWEMVRQCTTCWDAVTDHLVRSFWPGPLTVIVPRSEVVPEVVTAGGETVALRWPGHPVMQAIIRAVGFPLAAPSANQANALSPTQARHVEAQLGGRIPLIVDGGPCAVGIESTVVDVTHVPARILRPGMISEAALIAASDGLPWTLGRGSAENGRTLQSPGMLRKHYSPKAMLVVVPWKNTQELVDRMSERQISASAACVLAHEHIPDDLGFLRLSLIPHDPEAYARALYAELHSCDQAGAQWIVVEAPPAETEWDGIRDRLTRAMAE